jgi:rSAM/selenodomain-associated transferase 2
MKISVIVPVLHERDIINDLISHLRSLPGGKEVEIIVVEGSKERDTIEAIEDATVLKLTSPRGRGVQMNTGADSASGDIFLFHHADSRLPEEAFRLVKDSLKDERIMGGAFTLRFDKAPIHMRIAYPIYDLRGRITRIPFGDQSIFLRREAFDRMGGYKKYKILEDIDLMQRMRRKGIKIRILKEKVVSSSRRYLERGPIRNLIINLFIIFLFKLGVDPNRLEKLYPK